MTAGRHPGLVSPERWTLLEPLVDAALGLSESQRGIFLLHACTDEAMRAEVQEMVAECERPATLLDGPAAERFLTLSSAVDLPALAQALAGRYELEEQIGRGGMAVVYLARDLKHNRHVAIKALEPRAGVSAAPGRFGREIGIAARLAHPHILALYDSGEASGSPYYVMPHIAGPSLRERLTDEGQLPIEEAVRLASEIASALDYAHRQGVVHRDIKPDNVLLHDGTALVADFGIARATSVAGGVDPAVTAEGVSLGTPTYMSPEQVSQPDAVDGRTDIYALGCVLFEALTGQPPYVGSTPASVIAQHVGAAIPSARVLRDTVSPALDAVIRCALAKSPTDRYATGAMLREALSNAKAFPTQAPGANEPASIAVLPFVNLSADPENEYFSDGVTEEILNALTGIPSIKVASRSASFAFKGRHLGAADIGRELMVSTVLEGSLRRSGERIRMTVQLIDSRDGYTLWSERYDREVHDVFDIQEEIARTIVETLRVRLTNAEQGLLGVRRTENLEAYELYLRGRHCWFRRGMLKRSMGYFQRALDADPDYALAHHGLADGYGVLALYAFAPPGEVVPLAAGAVSRAVALAPELAEVRTSQGFLELLQWKWSEADETLQRAIRLNPRYALAYSFRAWLLTTIGREDDAALAARRAQELDPLSSATNGIAALVAYHRRDYALSVHECERALEIEPGSFLALLAITLSYAGLGDHERALERAREGVRLSPDSLFLRGLLGAVCGMAGLRNEARQILASLEAMSGTVYVAPMLRSWIHSHLGEMDEAFAALDAACAERSAPLGFGISFPIYDNMRTDPRFIEVLHRMKLR